jgi:hypothetical protein
MQGPLAQGAPSPVPERGCKEAEPLADLEHAPMSRASFTFGCSGPALEAGTMEVRGLAPALLALGRSREQANYQVNSAEAGPKVQIRAFAPGSFNVDFWLQVGLLAPIATSVGLSPIVETAAIN